MLANDSEYGLGASIWTEDLDKAEKLSRLVRSGMVTVNNVVFSDPRVPFGGVKHSGFGRELSRGGYMTGEREGYMAFLSGVQFVDHDSKNTH